MTKNSNTILSADDIDITFYSGKKGEFIHAVNKVSLSLEKGEILGIVGESGSGKSTLARIIMGLVRPDSGVIHLDGLSVQYPYKTSIYKDLQMIFQLPQDSFDPMRKIGSSIIDIQRNQGIDKKSARENAVDIFRQVGLKEEYLEKYPHQLSGGECQRAAIARSLVVNPKVVICDEITSALDVSVQAQVIHLLMELRKKREVSIIFISHDLSLVSSLCDQVLVMYNGSVIESGKADQVLKNPEKEYTRLLISSVLEIPESTL